MWNKRSMCQYNSIGSLYPYYAMFSQAYVTQTEQNSSIDKMKHLCGCNTYVHTILAWVD